MDSGVVSHSFRHLSYPRSIILFSFYSFISNGTENKAYSQGSEEGKANSSKDKKISFIFIQKNDVSPSTSPRRPTKSVVSQSNVLATITKDEESKELETAGNNIYTTDSNTKSQFANVPLNRPFLNTPVTKRVPNIKPPVNKDASTAQSLVSPLAPSSKLFPPVFPSNRPLSNATKMSKTIASELENILEPGNTNNKTFSKPKPAVPARSKPTGPGVEKNSFANPAKPVAFKRPDISKKASTQNSNIIKPGLRKISTRTNKKPF